MSVKNTQAKLSSRQISMMGIGGAIGAGLFIGSGAAVKAAGPAVIIAFAVAGLLVVLLMHMLAEMAAAHPESGAFSVYAEKALGPTAGTVIGWLYWIQLVIVVAAETTGAATIVGGWFPAIPQGVWALLFVVVLTAVNLLNVARFGQFEYWFAMLKVAAIVGFLVIGAALVFGWIPGVHATGIGNLFQHGGFMPNGIVGVCAGLLMVVFAFGGTEIVAIAAAESDDPKNNIRRAVRSVMVRVLTFYIGSAFIMVSVLPWDGKELATGPFVAVLSVARIPGIDTAMAVVVVIALLSAMNANIYASSRMILSLSERGIAPRFVARRAGLGIPRVAVIASVLFSLVTVVANFIAPDLVLPMLLNAVGSTLLILWSFIVVSQIVLRVRADRDPGVHLPVRMAGFPYLSGLALVLLVGVMVLTMFDGPGRGQLLATIGLTAVIAVLALVFKRRTPDEPVEAVEPAVLERVGG
ncbi:amino acid permease [Specibacter cremeus]|uniref:amino acid permease n=1 Tax=Specibacter cremeus TaxID=1629051 RepID=UPI000F778918|nr:amino acid permease [Specibacter cremeus]